MKKLKVLAVLVVLAFLFTKTPTYQWTKAMVIMGGYSAYEARHSVLHDEGIEISIPGGWSTREADWFPFVITFNDDYGFSRYMDKDLRMTVLYNFGYFPVWRSYSAYYDRESPYYNSFYGAYAVQDASGEAFGFTDGVADIDEMGAVTQFDMKWLVLSSIGNPNPEFSYEVTRFEPVTLLGEEGWQVFDADMNVSGSMHTYKEDYRAYIQYGRPPQEHVQTDYEVIDMKGRIYGRYYPERNISIFFYCIAAEEQVIDDWEAEIMDESEVIFSED